MRVNRIDQNTIRVQINKEELAQRGLKVLDLLGNKSKIQDFFYSILAEVDTDHAFTKDTPVSFQVMPNSGGLDVLISKVKPDSANELQQMLSQQNIDDDDSFDSDEFTKFYQQKATAKPENLAEVQNQNSHNYSFDDLGLVAELADNLKVEDLASSLYYYQGKYYLKLVFLDDLYSEIQPFDAWGIANEFGDQVSDNQMQTISKNGKCIMPQNALGNLRHYFYPAKNH